ncbi:hypothetical protein FGE12_27205 [Aggregicoccus sp. 17bor-14]|uniref:hypothetical protein n=1 Tax=Myxococcaceae TaxID=31 RepID=UPI00129C161D|nr:MULTISPECIES: hypothetical protein [Myxococcaceae]MBF5046133.1 hypothetical protein [Simulacricoccus sp. 17bor-14]MRI91860.1 hypothetical protein [Aggregicoccus sp. 17bor-14]
MHGRRASSALFLLLTLLGATPALAAGRTAVFPPRGTNVAEGPLAALGELLADAYGRASGQPVVLPAPAGAAVQPGMSLSAAAGALEADEYLETNVIGLETGMLVTSTRYRRDGAPVYSAQMRAQSAEDLPAVAQRLARALYQRVSPEATRSLDTVTEREARAPNRVASEQVAGFKAFLARPLGATFEPTMGVGFDLRAESGRHFLEFGLGFLVAADNSESRTGYGGLYADFGASYYLTQSEVSPYVGAGLSPRLLLGGELSTVANVAAWGQLGVMFLRTSSTRLYADLRVNQNLLPLRIVTGPDQHDSHFPTELGLHVGLGF